MVARGFKYFVQVSNFSEKLVQFSAHISLIVLAVKKPTQPRKEKVSKDKSESVKVTQEAPPAFSVALCSESENLNDYFDEPNLDLVMEEADPIQLETEVSTAKHSTLPEYLSHVS
jgi:hypothetical protein